jgi:hypothetical protein
LGHLQIIFRGREDYSLNKKVQRIYPGYNRISGRYID